jgi:hypothetical protein
VWVDEGVAVVGELRPALPLPSRAAPPTFI